PPCDVLRPHPYDPLRSQIFGPVCDVRHTRYCWLFRGMSEMVNAGESRREGQGSDERERSTEVMTAGEDGRFATELRSATEQSGLTLTVISQRLRTRQRPVSVATLSNWQSGRSLPGGEQSLGVVAALEELLGRSPDSLADLVGGPRLRGRTVRTASFLGHRSSKEVFNDALRELGFTSAQ